MLRFNKAYDPPDKSGGSKPWPLAEMRFKMKLAIFLCLILTLLSACLEFESYELEKESISPGGVGTALFIREYQYDGNRWYLYVIDNAIDINKPIIVGAMIYVAVWSNDGTVIAVQSSRQDNSDFNLAYDFKEHKIFRVAGSDNFFPNTYKIPPSVKRYEIDKSVQIHELMKIRGGRKAKPIEFDSKPRFLSRKEDRVFRIEYE